MPELEWIQLNSKVSDRTIEVAKIEAQREIAEQLNRLNGNIEKILKESGNPSEGDHN